MEKEKLVADHDAAVRLLRDEHDNAVARVRAERDKMQRDKDEVTCVFFPQYIFLSKFLLLFIW